MATLAALILVFLLSLFSHIQASPDIIFITIHVPDATCTSASKINARDQKIHHTTEELHVDEELVNSRW